jgi:hypothetical protein
MSRVMNMFATPVPEIKNRDGYPAYQKPLEEQYLQTLLTNTLGNTYYADQRNTGSQFYKELEIYRRKYNRETKAFVIDLAPYRSGMVPSSDKLTHYIYGWSDQVLQYISFATNGYGSMVEAVGNGKSFESC